MKAERISDYERAKAAYAIGEIRRNTSYIVFLNKAKEDIRLTDELIDEELSVGGSVENAITLMAGKSALLAQMELIQKKLEKAIKPKPKASDYVTGVVLFVGMTLLAALSLYASTPTPVVIYTNHI